MVKYIIIHNKHEGCYDFQYYEDRVSRIRLTSIRINPPKLFMFNDKEEASDFFEEYISDIDIIDNRCKKGEDVEHVEFCTCGVIEMDEDETPILFYNKLNQIFLLEHGPEMFTPNHELKNDIKNFNLTNKLIRKCKTLTKEQKKQYVELGKICQECGLSEDNDKKPSAKTDTRNNSIHEKNTVENIVISNTNNIIEETKQPEITINSSEEVTIKESKPKKTSKDNKETKPKKIKKEKKNDDNKQTN
jgi:hypothetical protein